MFKLKFSSKFNLMKKLMRKNLIFINLIFLGLFFQISEIKAGTEHNVSGFAWSENIGWISFNSKSDGSSVNYGVKIDPQTGYFSGYAWSENIGWISFNRNETGAPPTGDPCPSGGCIAKVENLSQIGKGNVKILGWARVLSVKDNPQAGGWDGWIRFDHGQSGEVYIDSQGNFHGWAWSDMVVGWISFNSQDPGAGGVSYKVVLDLSTFNSPPSVTLNSAQTPDFCLFASPDANFPMGFSWNFSDPNGDSQSAYLIQISTSSNFSTIFWQYSASSSVTSYVTPNIFSYDGKTFYARLKVWDSRGGESQWSNTISFTTPQNPPPFVNFTWSPQRVVANYPTQFCSIFSAGTCENPPDNGWSECFLPPCTFSWDFPGGNPSQAQEPNPVVRFTNLGENVVSLTITDSQGRTCKKTASLSIKPPLPQWREISPVSFLKEKFLAGLLISLAKNFLIIY